MAKRAKGPGVSFHVAFPGAKLSAAQVARLNEAVQNAVMAEVARLDFKGDLAVAPVAGGRTASGASVGSARAFDEYCGTPYPGWKKKYPGGISGDLPRPIINGIIVDILAKGQSFGH
jgi:hypothetical protein